MNHNRGCRMSVLRRTSKVARRGVRNALKKTAMKRNVARGGVKKKICSLGNFARMALVSLI